MTINKTIMPLNVKNLSYQIGNKKLIQDIEFSLVSGKKTVLLGPNGAGKSLTLRLCNGLLQPTSGSINWGIPEIKNLSRIRHHQLMVFQRPVLLRRSVKSNIEHALKLRRVPLGERKSRAMLALKKSGLEPLENFPARSLSGGEQQRLALARAWAIMPQVLFLDEPTNNLDPAAVRSVEDLISSFHNSGTKIIMTTHDLAQAKRIADEVLFIHNGKLLEQSKAESFFLKPKSPEGLAFISGELLC